MHIFALETDIRKLKAQFINETEQEVFAFPKHAWQFFSAAIPALLAFGGLIVAMLGLAAMGVSSAVILPITVVGAAAAGLFILAAYADWRFDFVLFTTDKMVLVDSSFFRQRVQPINLEHLSSVEGRTRLANVLGFGSLHFLLKDEPARQELDIDFVPHVGVVAARIADVITDFQRRKMRVGAPVLAESADMEEAMKVYEIQQNQQIQQATGEDLPGSTQAPPGQQPAQQPSVIKQKQEENTDPPTAGYSTMGFNG